MGLTVAVIAAGAGRPGLALVLGMLSLPAILVASSLPWAGLPALAPICGALSAAPIYPAIAGARGRPLERAVLGALGWFWMLAGAGALGLGSRLGMVHSASGGWTRSTGAAAHAVLVPLLAPHVLLGAIVFAVGALTLGVVLRATHIAMALLGALLWSAGLEGALRLAADDRLAGRGVLIAAAAFAVVVVEFTLRRPRPASSRRPGARARLAEPSGQGVAETLTT